MRANTSCAKKARRSKAMANAKDLFTRRTKRTRIKLGKRKSDRPRVSVFRSNKYIYAQIIDDKTGVTLASASSLEKDMRGKAGTGNIDAATTVGKMLAERAVKVGIKEVVFDRGGYRFHGRVKALADGAREGGLAF